jgi:hypothetical protein
MSDDSGFGVAVAGGHPHGHFLDRQAVGQPRRGAFLVKESKLIWEEPPGLGKRQGYFRK